MSEKHTTIISSDEPVSVTVRTDGRWFRVFHSLVESGVFARLSDSACRVMVVLAKHGSGDRWLVWPSMSTIIRLSGVGRRSAYRAISELEGEGVVRRRSGGGGRQSTLYEILDLPASPSLPFPPVREKLPVSRVTPHPCHGRHPTRVTGDTRIRTTEQEQLNNSNAAAVAELTGKGVDADVARDLVARFGVAASRAAVKKAQIQAGRLRNKAGFIRSAIENGYAAPSSAVSTDDEFLAIKASRQAEAKASERAAAAFYASRLGPGSI
jgi:hypothetical protein